MDKAKKTEIVDKYVGEALQKVFELYQGEIKMICDADFSRGKITIKIRDEEKEGFRCKVCGGKLKETMEYYVLADGYELPIYKCSECDLEARL